MKTITGHELQQRLISKTEINRIMRRLGFADGECSQNVAALRAKLAEMAANGQLCRFSAGNVSETLNNEEYARRLLEAIPRMIAEWPK